MEMDSLLGFGFKPTDEDIIHLLKMKRLDPDFSVQTIKETDFYNCDPWELPKCSGIQSKESIWYFFCKLYNYKKSKNRRRKTKSGNWKITGKGSTMKAKNTKAVIGTKKILTFCPRDSISKKAKAEWVMHEIRVKDDPRYKEEFVVCRLERKQDKMPSISTNGDRESIHLVIAEDTSLKFVPPPNQPLVSDRNHVAEKTSLLLSHNMQVESEQLPSRHLISDFRVQVAQFDALHGSNGLNCNSLPALLSPIYTEDDGFPCCNGLNHSSFSAQQSPINPEQRTSSYFESFTDSNLLNFQFGNKQGDLNSQWAVQDADVLEETGHTHPSGFNSSKSVTEAQFGDNSGINTETFSALVNGYSGIAAEDYSFDSICEAQFNSEEDTSLKFVPPPNQPLVSDRNHVAEKTSLLLSHNMQVESEQLPSHHLISDFRGQVAQFDALHGSNGLNCDSLPALLSPINTEDVGFPCCNGLNHSSFSAQQSPINPEQRSSSNFDSFTDCNLLNFQFGNQQGDLNSQWAVQDADVLEETGHTHPSGFNSSKSVTKAQFGDNRSLNTETSCALVNGYSGIAAEDYSFDSICEAQFNSEEDTSLKFVPPPNQLLVSDRNRVAEKTSLLLSHNMQVESDNYQLTI